jgi:hypothetical protein
MRYLVIHSLPKGLTVEDVRRIQASAQSDADVHGIHGYLNLTEGRAVCIFESTSREKLEEFFRRNNMAFDSIVPVELEGEHGQLTDLRYPEEAVV